LGSLAPLKSPCDFKRSPSRGDCPASAKYDRAEGAISLNERRFDLSCSYFFSPLFSLLSSSPSSSLPFSLLLLFSSLLFSSLSHSRGEALHPDQHTLLASSHPLPRSAASLGARLSLRVALACLSERSTASFGARQERKKEKGRRTNVGKVHDSSFVVLQEKQHYDSAESMCNLLFRARLY
jgi:hypothetical protein